MDRSTPEVCKTGTRTNADRQRRNVSRLFQTARSVHSVKMPFWIAIAGIQDLFASTGLFLSPVQKAKRTRRRSALLGSIDANLVHPVEKFPLCMSTYGSARLKPHLTLP